MIIYLETANQRLSKNIKNYRVFENKILSKIFQQGGPLHKKSKKKNFGKTHFLIKKFQVFDDFVYKIYFITCFRVGVFFSVFDNPLEK